LNILTPARLVLDEAGIPYAPQYGDVYHSRAGGYAQAREVFMAGNGLPQAWAGRRSFVILETGFGLGTNFLATWAAWRADPKRCERLHFVSVERHPFPAADLRAWHGRDEEMASLGGQLADAWPVLTPGLHRIELEQGRVVLTLVLGDALAVLPRLRLRADALYLDGFAPSRNPDLWSAPVFQALAQLAAPGATLATYTIARSVADGLTDAGFEPRRAPGFGGKRDMLLGRRLGVVAGDTVWPHRTAMVIGAGIAGITAADSLAARGWEVQVLDSAEHMARGASSTPAGALHALLARDDSRQARFTRAAYLMMGRRLAALAGDADWSGKCGRIDCLDDDGSAEGAARVLAGLGFPPAFVRLVDAAEASALAGTRVARGGYWFEGGAWLHAGSFCAALLAARGAGVQWRGGCAVASLRRAGVAWQACDAAGGVIAEAAVVVLAAGLEIGRLAGTADDAQVLPVQRVRGQLTGVPAALARAPNVLVSGEGYCLPAVDGVMWTGASYGPNQDDLTIRPAEHEQNLQRLARLLPDNDFTQAPFAPAGHAGVRAVAPDRMPLAGALPDARAIVAVRHAQGTPDLDALPRLPGLYASGAMASRGLTWAALSADIIASEVAGEPMPVERDLLEAVDPARFLARRLRRGGAA
jgi:tRNA 5-methylaminomethyl-2-thiouridine biosynthesis bifunctional protein